MDREVLYTSNSFSHRKQDSRNRLLRRHRCTIHGSSVFDNGSCLKLDFQQLPNCDSNTFENLPYSKARGQKTRQFKYTESDIITVFPRLQIGSIISLISNTPEYQQKFYQLCMYLFVGLSVCLLICWLVGETIDEFIHSSIHAVIRSFVHLSVHSFILVYMTSFKQKSQLPWVEWLSYKLI